MCNYQAFTRELSQCSIPIYVTYLYNLLKLSQDNQIAVKTHT